VVQSGNPGVAWTLSTGRTIGGTFIPGPRMLVLVQGVNRLIKKAVLDASTRSLTISESPSLQPGEQLFFTVFFLDGAPQQGQAFFVGTPTVGGATAPFNMRFADPTLDNNGNVQVDPMSGGYPPLVLRRLEWRPGVQRRTDPRGFESPEDGHLSCSRRRGPSA
jgi:hypothetical protein